MWLRQFSNRISCPIIVHSLGIAPGLKPGQPGTSQIHQSDEHRLMGEIDGERISPQEFEPSHQGRPGKIRQGNTAAVASIEEIAKSHTHQDNSEPGKERKVVY